MQVYSEFVGKLWFDMYGKCELPAQVPVAVVFPLVHRTTILPTPASHAAVSLPPDANIP